MMVLLSPNTKSPSTLTGTRTLGCCASSGPSSARLWAMPISSQVHRTLRTLIDEALPRMRSVTGTPSHERQPAAQRHRLAGHVLVIEQHHDDLRALLRLAE